MSTELPIASVLPEIFSTLQTHSRLILQAPPGAGKSTFLPLQLLNEPSFCKLRIVMLEPRRLAARSIAEFLASQLNEAVGDTVGLRMKQMTKVSAKTRLTLVTEGVLTRMIQNDPELDGVDILIFDEFHERSLAADLALALSLEVQAGLRDDLRILIMSATLDQQGLAAQLDAPVVSSDGRSFPVTTHYRPVKLQRHQHGQPEWQRFWTHLQQLIVEVIQEYPGSLLVFLPGQGEIIRVQQALAAQTLSQAFGKVTVTPLYGQLSKDAQWQAIAPAAAGERKIVLTTNIAETSLTIEGIQLVIDAGYCRRAVFLPKAGVTQLQTVAISKASAIQRAGRAGRLGPGQCFRLEEEARFQRREAFEPAEIETSDLTELCFDVLLWGSRIEDMPWVQTPPKNSVLTAMQHLRLLGVVDEQDSLTRAGRLIGKLGLPLRAGCLLIHTLLAIQAHKVSSDILSQLPIFTAWVDEAPRIRREGNSVSMFADLQKFRRTEAYKSAIRWWKNKVQQAIKMLAISSAINKESPQVDSAFTSQLILDSLHLFAFAFPDRIGFRRTSQAQNRFYFANGATGIINAEQWVESAEQQRQLSEGKCFLIAAQVFVREQIEIIAAAAISESELRNLMPWLFHSNEFVGWNADGTELIAEIREQLGSAIFARKPLQHDLSAEQQQQALAELLRSKGLKVLAWNKSAEQLTLRMQLAHQYYADLGFPTVSNEALLAEIEQWCLPMVNISSKQLPSLKHLSVINVQQALLTRLDYAQQQQLNEFFPEYFQAPSGRKFPIQYRDQAKPKLCVQLQELFGVKGVISVAQGRLPVLAELLSPARRPIQITEDIGSFWQTSYPEIAKDMRGQYPKHRWPDDPVNEKPGRSIKTR